MDSKYGRLFTEQDVQQLLHYCMDAPRIQSVINAFEGQFPKDEPLFLLRAQDEAAVSTIDHYRDQADYLDTSGEFLASIDEDLEVFIRWQADHTTKIPD